MWCVGVYDRFSREAQSEITECMKYMCCIGKEFEAFFIHCLTDIHTQSENHIFTFI